MMCRRFKFSTIAATLILSLAFTSGWALRIKMYSTQHPKQSLGYVVAVDSRYGLLLKPHLHGLVPGVHGFHIHQYPHCTKAGLDAGGHYDPQHTGHHLGPYGDGHLGDLPVLVVNRDGKATIPVLAPRLHLKQIIGHSLMIHQGKDTYHRSPALGRWW